MRTAAGSPVAALLPVDRGVGVALHRQIYDGLRRAMLDGLLRAGQRLPSTRALAIELAVSRLPVLLAYEQLRHAGYLDGRSGSGTYVRAVLPDDALWPARPGPVAKPRREDAPRAASEPARDGRTSPPRGGRAARGHAAGTGVPRGRDEGGLRPLRVRQPALDAFPYALWARLVARHAHRLSPTHLAYGDPPGVGALRAAVAEHLRTARAVRCEAEQVLITSGSQAALRLCAAVLLGPGDRVAVEEPGYPGARAALGAGGAELVPVPVDAEGLDVAALAALAALGAVRAAYVTPSHQYPLGAAMSAPRRLALLEWAARHGAWLIEDDYDSEFRYVSRPLGSLQGMDARGRVVYVGTFSKVLFPAVRVGYLVAPPALWDAFVATREASDGFSPTLYQLALAEVVGEGHFARHLRRMRGVYQRRREALLGGLERHATDVLTVHNADGGLHVVTRLAADTADVAVAIRAAARGLRPAGAVAVLRGPRGDVRPAPRVRWQRRARAHGGGPRARRGDPRAALSARSPPRRVVRDPGI